MLVAEPKMHVAAIPRKRPGCRWKQLSAISDTYLSASMDNAVSKGAVHAMPCATALRRGFSI